MRGRKRKPTAIKKLLNVSKRPLNDREPQYGPASTEPPAWLNGHARAVWDEYAPMLAQRGILTVADRLKFEALCVAAGHLRRAQSDTSPAAALKPTDEVRYMLLVGKFGSDFGMDPASRARLKTPEPQKGHWLEALTGDVEPTASGPGDPVH